MKVNINPEISPQEAKCFLTIYHDVGLKLEESTNLVVKTFSFGHFYLGLSNGEINVSYGFNPINIANSIIGKGKVKTEDERLSLHNQYEQQTQNSLLYSKHIPLSFVQYCKATSYVEKYLGVKQTYIVAERDCSDFVQDVYHETGLSLYFTKVFTKQELLELGTEVCLKVLSRYGARDIFSDIFTNAELGCSNVKEVSNKLNIPVNQVVEVTNNINPLMFYDSLSSSNHYFTVFLNDKDHHLLDEVTQEDNANKLAEMVSKFTLSDERVVEAKDHLTSFFGGMMINNPYINSSSLGISMNNLFPQYNEETQNTVNEIMGITDQIFNNFNFTEGAQNNNYNFAQDILNISYQTSQMMGESNVHFASNETDKLD
jgi:hypothetical protein